MSREPRCPSSVRLFVHAMVIMSLTTTATKAAPKPTHIGMLCAPCSTPNVDAFFDELNKLGWVEGRNLTIDRKEGKASDLNELSALATELVESKADLIVATNPQTARAAKEATSKVPIVIFLVSDPVGMGLAASLSNPGGNVTGAATFAAVSDFNGKAFELIRELLPAAKRMSAIVNPLNEMHRLNVIGRARPVAEKAGFELQMLEIRSSDDLPSAVAAAKADGADVLYVLPDAMITYPTDRAPKLALGAGLPAISLQDTFAKSGGLMSYGPNFAAVARLGAHYVDRVLKGAKPADLPIEEPSKYELVINLKTAKALGLEIPASLIARADEVIE